MFVSSHHGAHAAVNRTRLAPVELHEQVAPLRGVEQMRGLGVGRVMVPGFFFGGPGGTDRLAEFGERVIAPSLS